MENLHQKAGISFLLSKRDSVKRAVFLFSLLISGGFSAQVQNGLNSGTVTAELGGNLIRNTNVTLLNASSKYDLVFNGEGQFGVGNNLAAGGLNNFGLANSRAIFSHSNTAASGSFSGVYNTLAAYYKSSANVNSDVTAIIADVDADCSLNNIYGINSSILGNAPTITGINVMTKSRTTGGSDVSYGIVTTAMGATANYGGVFIGHSQPGLGSTAYAYGVSGSAIGAVDNYGGFFRADSAAQNRGVYSEARNIYDVSSSNCAVYGVADGLGMTGNSYLNIGVKGIADFAQTSFGVAGYLSNGNYAAFHTPAINAAVYGNAVNSSSFSIPYAGYFDGNILVTGSGTITGAVWAASDRNFKKEIQPITNAQEIISKLRPVSFFYNNKNECDFKFSDKKNYGIIAQELEQVLPELVSDAIKPAIKDKSGSIVSPEKSYKVVNHTAFFGLLLASAQDQQKQLDEQKQLNTEQRQLNEKLQKQLEEQQQMISDLQKKAGIATGVSSGTSDISGFSMSQNEPNPFTHETVVNYTLPQQVVNAYMAVYDLSGKQITTFPINQKGSSSMTITSEKLAAGIYIYSIVADGKVVDSKRMIVADK